MLLYQGNCPNNYTITPYWTATDACGNASCCTQTIKVRDTIPPVITCPCNVKVKYGECTDPVNTGCATAVDNCDPAPVITYSDTTSPCGSLDKSKIKRVWTATDACGNTSSCVQKIRIEKKRYIRVLLKIKYFGEIFLVLDARKSKCGDYILKDTKCAEKNKILFMTSDTLDLSEFTNNLSEATLDIYKGAIKINARCVKDISRAGALVAIKFTNKKSKKRKGSYRVLQPHNKDKCSISHKMRFKIEELYMDGKLIV